MPGWDLVTVLARLKSAANPPQSSAEAGAQAQELLGWSWNSPEEELDQGNQETTVTGKPGGNQIKETRG